MRNQAGFFFVKMTQNVSGAIMKLEKLRFRAIALPMLSVVLFLTFITCSGKIDTVETAGDSLQTPQRMVVNDDIAHSRQNAITRAVHKVSPAVVGVNVTQIQSYRRRQPFQDPFWNYFFPEFYRDRYQQRKVESLGSGFLISADGYVLTNQHVVDHAAEIVVTMSGGRRFDATKIGEDKETDIALLKIDGKNLPYIPFGRSDDLLVGEWVIALGNPFGLFQLNDQPTVTVGVISATNRDWGRTENGKLFLDMIQTDAAINRGNSGGPLVNALGQAIGMNTFIYTGGNNNQGSVGIGFAIPSERILDVVAELKSHGRVNRDYWLGILDVQTLNPYIVDALDLGVDRGVIITQIETGSPAHRAGLRDEDVVVNLQGEKVNTRADLIRILKNLDLKVGSELTFSIVRDKKRTKIIVKLGSRER